MTTRQHFISQNALPAIVLFLLPCFLLWRVVFFGDAFLPADLLRDLAPWRSGDPHDLVPWNPLMWDGMAEFYPWRFFAATSLHHGILPLWNPHQFCGTPFVANSQSAVFYPLNLLFVLLPVAKAFGVSALLHLFLTGLFLYAFLRAESLRLTRPAALLGAVVWQMSMWQVSWLALPTFLCVSAWLPLALLLVQRAAEKPTLRRGTVLGVCLGLMFLAGHLQVALYCFLLIAAYALFCIAQARKTLRTNGGRYLVCALLAIGLMAGFAAPQLLPALELSHVSHRAGTPVNWAGYKGYLKLAVPVFHLVTLFLPGFFGNPTQGSYWGATNYAENACYVGILALLLAALGLRPAGRFLPHARFFGFAGLIALLMALGTPLNALLYFGIPGFAQSGSPGRILGIWSFCAAMLAAIGAERLLTSDQEKIAKPLTAAFGVVTLLFLAAFGDTAFWLNRNAAAGTLTARLAMEGDLWRLPVGILLAAGAAYGLWRRGSLTRSALGGALVMLAALDLLAAGIGYNRSTAAKNVYPVTPGIAFLQQHLSNERMMPVNQRWSLYNPPPAVLPPNAATAYGLDDTQGYDSLLTGQYIQFAAKLNSGPPAPQENGNMVFTNGYLSPLASETAARYIVSLGPLPTSGTHLRQVAQDNSMFIYENSDALSRVRIAQGSGIAQIRAATPTRLTVWIDGASREGDLVIADQWYPGWQASVNGQQAALTESPEIFRAVHWNRPDSVTNGSPLHIEMRYLPTTFRLGLYGLCLAFAVTAAVGSAALRSRGRSRHGIG